MLDNLSLNHVRHLIEQDGSSLLSEGTLRLSKLRADGTEGYVPKIVGGVVRWAPDVVGSGGGGTPTVVTINTNTTIAATDSICLVTGGVTITLPASPTDGLIHDIKDAAGTAGASNITVNGNGKNIDGAASQLITSNYESMRVVYKSTAWYRI